MILEAFCEWMLMSLSARFLVKTPYEVAFDANTFCVDVA